MTPVSAWRSRAAALWHSQRERLLLATSALLLAASLLNPTLPMQRRLFDHLVVLDVTQSMNVQDYQQDGKPVARLAFAKQALRQAMLKLPCGSRMGLALFTEYRSYVLVTPVEVCANLQELRTTLDSIDGRMAWIGGSEVAKGLYSGLAVAAQMEDKPSLVFVTDGHEAPPLNPRHRPPFNGKQGEVPGLLVGVGGLTPQPIPKLDPQGRPLGTWRADEVMQTDPRSQGRGASVAGEKMAEGEVAAELPAAAAGGEHLSSMREAYLRLLARETGLGFTRLQSAEGLAEALTAPALARPVPARAELRWPLAVLALCLLLARHGTLRRGLRLRPSFRT